MNIGFKASLTPIMFACFALLITGCKDEKERPPKVPEGGVSASGHLEKMDCNGIAGWAWNPKQPDYVVRLDVYDGSKLLGTIRAGEHRNDLEKSGVGNGKHGFVFPVPPSLRDGKPHRIWVRHSGTANDLEGSPTTFTCVEGK